MVYGTDNGVYLSDLRSKNKVPVKVISVMNVTQLDVLEEQGILIVLAGSFSLHSVIPLTRQLTSVALGIQTRRCRRSSWTIWIQGMPSERRNELARFLLTLPFSRRVNVSGVRSFALSSQDQYRVRSKRSNQSINRAGRNNRQFESSCRGRTIRSEYSRSVFLLP